MKTPAATKLDTSTPKWPVLAVNLADPPNVDINGASTPLDPADPQRDAVGHATRQARALGRAVRMTVTDAAGEQRLIVTADGVVTLLDPPPATGKPGRTSNPAQKKGKAKTKRRLLDRLPRPARWGFLGLGVVTAFSLVVIVTHGKAAPAAEAAVTLAAPIPASGQLYTELAPPGWSQQAAWVLPISDKTAVATDPASGITAAVTPDDRATADSAAQRHGSKDQWLSILGPDGATRWAFSLNHAPTSGPVITRVDGATVALVVDGDQIRYWPIDTGVETDVGLPTGAQLSAGGESVLLTLPGDHLGYLHGGAIQTVQTLPRTDPAVALDGAVLVTQPDTGAWWVLRSDAAPVSARPTAPPGAGAVDKVLGVSATHVLIAWTPAVKDPKTPTVIVAAYDRTTGALIASTTAPADAIGQGGPVVSNDTRCITAAGAVVLTTTLGPASVVVVAGFTATMAADRVYGEVQGKAAVIGT
ncbi:MAG TPA: hypothetical protein VFC16_10740, partial [Nakamurella sp.]|nr:hypothetical protein [Nakamurella sp.]